jgi:hypothetical protein
LIEGLEKDLEKLKRLEENIKVRKTLTLKNGAAILDETDADRARIRQQNLYDDVIQEGAGPLVVNEERLQVFRHKSGQLDSLKNLDLDELEKLRVENEKSLKVLEEQYWAKRENTLAGKLMRQRLGFSKKSEAEAASPPEKDSEGDEHTFGADRIDPDDEA